MTKSKSAAALHTATKEAFEFHKNAKKLYVTSDGQCFLEDSKNAAELHVRRAGVKLFPVTREEFFAGHPSDELLDALKGAELDLNEGDDDGDLNDTKNKSEEGGKEGDSKEPDDKGSEEGKKEEGAEEPKDKGSEDGKKEEDPGKSNAKLSDLITDKPANKKQGNKR